MKMFFSLALAAVLCAAPRLAVAQDEDAEVTKMAKEHYKAGLDAYKAGKYDVAIKELKKAYLLKRIPALLINIGATYRKMGDLDLALHFYGKYLEEAPADAKDRGEVEKTITEIKTEKETGAPPANAEAAQPEKPAPVPAKEEPAAKPRRAEPAEPGDKEEPAE
jgi:tetratricopeptide (TPR) repeat protein